MAIELLRERLPPEWSYGVTSDGRVFFISERQRATSWLHPVTGRPVQTGHQVAPGLPKGWELDYTPEGVAYFINHNNQQTTFSHPVTGKPLSEDNIPPPPSSPPLSPVEDIDFRRGTAKQRSLKAPTAKRNPVSQVMRSGFLYRLESGGLSKTWKRRWCVVADFALFVYKGDDEKASLGSILLPSYRINPCTIEDRIQKEFAFKLEHENTKTVYFHTDTQSDLNGWISSLQQAATMKGNSGFVREANNNIRPQNHQRITNSLPPDRPDTYAERPLNHHNSIDGHQQGLESWTEPHWKNPNPGQNQPVYTGKGPPTNMANGWMGNGQWRSVPDLGRDSYDPRIGQRDGSYDPHGSLHSLPPEMHRTANGSSSRSNSGLWGHSHDPLHHPRADANGVLNDPRGSLRSLPGDVYRSSPALPQVTQTGSGVIPSLPQDRGRSDPYQRSSVVSDHDRNDSSNRGSYASWQRLPLEARPDGYYNGARRDQSKSSVDENQGDESEFSGSYRVNSDRPLSDASKDGDVRGREPGGWWEGSGRPAGPMSPRERQDARFPEKNRRYPDSGRERESYQGKSQPSGDFDPSRGQLPPGAQNPQSFKSQDPRASYASSGRHSLAGSSHADIPGHHTSKQSLKQPYDNNSSASRNSLSRMPPLPMQHHATDQGHTYVNLPEMSRMAKRRSESPPPRRPPYPTAVRDQIIREIADTHSPATAERLITANELNKERMQQLPFFQYPTPPHEQTQHKLQRPVEDGEADPAKRLFQSSDSQKHLLQQSDSQKRLSHSSDLQKHLFQYSDSQKRLSQYSDSQKRLSQSNDSQKRLSQSNDSQKRLSQFSDSQKRLSGAQFSESGLQQSDVGVSRSNQAYSDDSKQSNRRQDSGSGRFSDSFEQEKGDGRRTAVDNKAGLSLGISNGTETDALSSQRSSTDQNALPSQKSSADQEARTLRQAFGRVQSFRQSATDSQMKRQIQTVKEEPDMPDSEVLETKLKKNKLNGVRLRMSISAGDLIGKTHDELVLLLIQLRRNQAALEKARDFYREQLNKSRSMEREYRRQRNDSVGQMDRSLEDGHQSFVDTRTHLDEVEKKLEVYRPIISLVDNMVTMGSLYGGDNLMLATQYRKHLLRPDQYQPPRKMLEFSRKYQEERVVASIENDIRQLTATEVDLEEKIERLNELDRLLQEQSFKVSSFREDKELLEKALAGILRQKKDFQNSAQEQRHLTLQLNSVEKELSRVTQELAEASKALEETTAENNKIEHEVALLRTKVHGELKRSKSAPSLASENANTKVKMERELARVQNMLQGLSQQGEKLSQAMSTIRRTSSGTQLAAAFERDEEEQAKKRGTYFETDVDSGEQIDLAQQIPQASPLSPSSPQLLYSPPEPDAAASDIPRPIISHGRQDGTLDLSSSFSNADNARMEWDIGDADDNTKRFYGLLPREKPRGLTVRDVKRQSEQRREREKMKRGPDDDQERDLQEVALKVSSTDSEMSTIIHARYPSYTSSQSSLDLSGRGPQLSAAPFYENLQRSGSMPALNNGGSASNSRRSSLALLAPKPFTPYQDKTSKPFRSEIALSTLGVGSGSGSPFNAQHTPDSVISGFKPSSSFFGSRGGASNVYSGTRDGVNNGQPGVAMSHVDRAADVLLDSHLQEPVHSRSSSLPAYAQRGNNSGLPSLPPWSTELAALDTGILDAKRSPTGRYLTISSSEPTRLESQTFLSSSFHSSAGDLISNAKIDNVPDIVKSSQTQMDKLDQIDQSLIEREILYKPQKVEIPERYDPEADAEELTEEEKVERQEKAERIKRMLAHQSILAMSQPDINGMPTSHIHNQLAREKQERTELLTLNQELARQVTQRSKKAAAERRKTWSGGQLADIKKQYEAELSANPDQFIPKSRISRQANVIL